MPATIRSLWLRFAPLWLLACLLALAAAPAAVPVLGVAAARADDELADDDDDGDDGDDDAPAAGVDDDDGPKPLPAAEVIEKMRPHAVRVLVYAKGDDGRTPTTGRLQSDMANERPTRIGGFWWDEDGRVVIQDPIVPDAFIRKIEFEIVRDGRVQRVPAEVAGRHPAARLMLLAPSRPLPEGFGAEPLDFAEAPPRRRWSKMRGFIYRYNPEVGDWTSFVGGSPERLSRHDADGAEYIAAGVGDTLSLIVDSAGRPVGLAHEGQIAIAPDAVAVPWRGKDIATADFITPAALGEQVENLRGRLDRSALEVHFRFRQRVEEEELRNRNRNQNFNRRRGGENAIGENAVEYRGTGLRIGPGRFLVPAEINRELIAKLESIDVLLPDGTRREARFAGALRQFMGVLVDVDGELPGSPLFEPAAAAAPAAAPAAAESAAVPAVRAAKNGEFFWRAHIEHVTGKRKERYEYDRWRGTPATFRDLPGVLTFTNESQGDLAIGADGAVLALAIALRPPPSAQNNYYLDVNAAFRPVDALARLLAAPDAIDETMLPKPKEEERRLVAFGIEAQALNPNLAKWFGAEAATRGGQIGMLVTYVYPDGPAAKMGIVEHDILLRLTPPNRGEPVDLAGGSAMPWYNLVSSDSDALRQAERGGDYLPPFWPSPENRLTALLTGYGPGRVVTLEYVRGGVVGQVTFTTEMGPPDFQSAPTHRSRALGLTVKPVTYEVARFFRRSMDDGGVIIARVDPGEKAQVAGLGAFMLITRVDGSPVSGLDDFRAKTAGLEAGTAKRVEFTLEMMGKTRLAKIDFGE